MPSPQLNENPLFKPSTSDTQNKANHSTALVALPTEHSTRPYYRPCSTSPGYRCPCEGFPRLVGVNVQPLELNLLPTNSEETLFRVASFELYLLFRFVKSDGRPDLFLWIGGAMCPLSTVVVPCSTKKIRSSSQLRNSFASWLVVVSACQAAESWLYARPDCAENTRKARHSVHDLTVVSASTVGLRGSQGFSSWTS